MNLADLDVLAIDCQTTGATPSSGCLVEVGWARVNPSGDACGAPETCLICLPEGQVLSPSIQKLTGIPPDELMSALPACAAWERLAAAVQDIRDRSGGRCIAVIHYARFERPFLKQWHGTCAPETPFPFDIICTHGLARRLLPGLPRCGLRALAGYFGMGLPREKRCAPHLAATELIWRQLLAHLTDQGIEDLAALQDWLRSAPAPARAPRAYPMPADLRRGLPDPPGVYRFRRSNGDLLYVGKAKSLKQRIRSYFQGRRHHPEHILDMLTQAVDLDYTATATALEAALREAEEIQCQAPEYNVQLQAGGQPPVFSSHDFQQTCLAGEGGLPLGPWPSQKAVEPLAALVRCLARDPGDVEWAEETICMHFGLPPAAVLPLAVFNEGLAGFQQRTSLAGNKKDIARRLMILGAEWWRLARERAPDEGPEDGPDAGEKRVWSPDDVARFLESVVRRGAFYLRRGRWFRLLCEATLRWNLPGGGDATATLALQGRRIAFAGPTDFPGHLPPPANHRWTPRQRQACFDGSTYTRFRVLTTELRRLVSEDRRIHLCLRPGVVLDKAALARLLFWI